MNTRSATLVTAAISIVVLAACGLKPAPKPLDKADEIHQYTTVSKTGTGTVDPVHGPETGMWYGAVNGINGTNANGVSFVRSYKDGAFVATVNLNILMAPKGQHYEAFLTDGAGTSVDMGELRSIIGDARHSLTFETKEDVSALKKVVVRLGDRDIAEGTLKVPAAPTR